MEKWKEIFGTPSNKEITIVLVIYAALFACGIVTAGLLGG